MKITTIKISKTFKDWLQSKGNKGESFEDVIKRLLKWKTTKNDRVD